MACAYHTGVYRMKKFLFAAPLFLALAACGQAVGCADYPVQDSTPMASVAAPVAPVASVAAPAYPVMAAPSHDGFLTGMIAGHLMTRGGGGGGSSHTVVNKTVTVNKTIVNKVSAPAPRFSAPRPSFSGSGFARSSGFRMGRR
jgi:hypothetical protein